MPRRSILSASERDTLLALPDSQDDLIRYYTFNESDLSLIRQRRGDANRLGFLALGACSYKSLESILRQGLERLPLAQQNLPLLPEEHINLRGPGYYH
ncbi:hypothetical protein J3D48_006196 [Pseudomonas fluorescens]|uniref:DUF4158 domain-containing protein n=1 Tax=Pseudomonas fluorescens TaxID=294 RepID=UPI003F59FE13|nr:hypothetical protein [Pseudomonas fluorescens]